jgi:biotin operon repressor
MVATRLLVLDFVHEYIERWRYSPSLGEIGAELGVSRKHVSKAIASLVDSGLLVKTPGPRGLALPDQRDTAIRLLSSMGFQVSRGQQVVTKSALLSPTPVEYIPLRTDRGQHGRQGRKKRAKAKAKALASVRQAPVESVDPVKVAADDRYARQHPERAAEEAALRSHFNQALIDHGHRRNGTAATLASAAQVRQGALARLHQSGTIDDDQLAWALEIAAEHERIDAEVGMAAMKWGVRVDVGGQGNRALESLWRVRRAQAYRLWWAGLIDLCREFIGTRYLVALDGGSEDLSRVTTAGAAAAQVLSMIVDDLGVTWAARRLRIGMRKMRKLLEEALNLWPKVLRDVRNEIDEDDLIAVQVMLG